jgi:trigger factor
MKTTLEQVSKLERKLNIEVPASEVQAAFQRAYSGIQRNVTIKGFRKGKAPLSTVKSLFKDRVTQDVAQDLVQRFFDSALREHQLQLIGDPAVEFDSVAEDAEFQFTAEFEVRPEVKLVQIEKLSIKKERMPSTEKGVTDTLESVRQSRAESKPLLEDRPAAKGDLTQIDFEGIMNGQPLENGSAQDHEIELGSDSFIPGFEDGIVGMKVGATREIQLKFPETYHVETLAGQPVTFKVTLKAIKQRVLPELNDEFAKAVSPQFQDLAALKKQIEQDITQRETKRIQDELRSRVLQALVDQNPVDIPKSLLNEQRRLLIEDTKNRMQSQGMPEDRVAELAKTWDEDFTKMARNILSANFLVDTIALEKNLIATTEDFAAKLTEFQTQSGVEAARVAEFYGKPERRNRLMYQITEGKVVEFVLSKADLKEVSREELEAETKSQA